MVKREAGSSAPVYRITTARPSISDDQQTRVRGYVVSMSIRIVCFLLAALAQGWLRWTFVVGAVFIPYLAVVFANGGREPTQDPPDTLLDQGETPNRQLPS